jgi:hypothetical protein
VENIFDEIDPRLEYCYRLGYCPLGIEGEFASAMTLLLPGMSNTPEGELIRRSGLPRRERLRMRSQVNALNFRQLLTDRDFSLLRWFHEHGIPQVIARESTRTDRAPSWFLRRLY